jgi:CheY-like chemotaxis protein
MENTGTKPERPILVVEDSPEDYELTVRALAKTGYGGPLYRCEDGDEALDFLFRSGKYADPKTSPRPGIILLDLNLPGTNGREILTEIKGDDHLKRIPVIVLTTSSETRDIEQCYAHGANSYITKPVDLAGFYEIIRRLTEYWFRVVTVPEGE